jgi:tetratricopeptide (TPR) repeat protein
VDTDLPNEGAHEVARALHSLSSKPHLVLMVSAKTEFDDLDRFQSDGQLLKPFMGRQLLVMLQGLARMGQSRSANDVAALKAPSAQGRAQRALENQESSRARAQAVQAARVKAAKVPSRSKQIRQARDIPGNLAAPAEALAQKKEAPAASSGAARIPMLQIPSRELESAGIDLEKASAKLVGSGSSQVRPQVIRTIMHQAGTLEKVPFPALLYKLFANQSTGTLTLNAAGSQRSVFFIEGEPVWAVSEAASESLGAVMVQLGYLEMEELNGLLDRFVEGVPVGRALLESNLVDSEQLLHGLDRQVYERVISCFSLTSGRYIFQEGDEWLGEVRRFPQNPVQLISDGVERYVGPNVLAQHLQGHTQSYVVRTEKFAWFKPHFPAVDRNADALALINGARTLKDLTRESQVDLMSLLRLIWSLHLADMVDFCAEPRTKPQRSPDKPQLPRRKPTDPDMRLFTKTGGDALSQDEREQLARKVLYYYMRLGYEDGWTLLGVERDATPGQIKDAYQRALANFPEEKLGALSAMVQSKAQEVKEALERAYRTLAEPSTREGYARRIKRRTEDQEQRRQKHRIKRRDEYALNSDSSQMIALAALEEAERAPKAPPRGMPVPVSGNTEDSHMEASQNQVVVAIARARRAIKESLWKDAWRALKLAADYDPYNPEVMVLKTWVAYNLPHDDRKRQARVCRQRLENALAINDGMAKTYYYLGRILEDQGDLMEALKNYRAAVALDKQFEEAREASLRLNRHPEVRAKRAAQRQPEEINLVERLKGLFSK